MALCTAQASMEVLNRVVTEFPDDILRDQIEFLFVPLVMRLVNDDSPACR